MPYNFIDRLRIHRRAKAKLGLKSSAGDRHTFMQQCIDVITSESGGDDDDARAICEMLWDEGSDLDEFE